MNTITTFLQDVRSELYRVSWPTQKQTIQYTIAVIAISAAFALLLGALDALFALILNKLVV